MYKFEKDNITIPHGDSLEFDYVPKKIALKPEDIVVFTVKKKLSDTKAVIRKEYQGIQHYGSIVHISVSHSEMKKLEAGTYVYDLVAKNNEMQTLLLGPAKIKITEVVNNE